MTFVSRVKFCLALILQIIPTRLTRIAVSFLHYFYKNPPPQALMSSPQLIQHNGYKVSEHDVETEDGYILTLFRIEGKNTANHGKDERQNLKFKPVVLQHGYLNSSDDWLVLPPEIGLPYILADRGHDVWLANSRGNTYSLKHTKLTVNDLKFWDFGIDEVGIYDVKAVVNYILNLTQTSQLNFIGHSLGTTAFFITMAENPELNSKFHKMVALSPAFYVGNSKSPLLRWPNLLPQLFLQIYSHVIGGRAIPFKMNKFIRRHAPALANAEFMRQFSQNLLCRIGGWNRQQMTKETVSLLLGHTPGNTSGKLVVHICQAMRSKKPMKFDYGVAGNLKKYGTQTPPTYDLSLVSTPVQAWYALNDLIIDPKDAIKTIGELGNVVQCNQVENPKWTHLDFTYGKDVKIVIYDKVVQYLEQNG